MDHIEQLTQNASESESVFDSLKNFEQFGHKIFNEFTWNNACQIREIIENSKVIKEGKPVLYAGARWDIVQALAYTNAESFIFIDPAYARPHRQDESSDMPDEQIKDIGGKNLIESTEGTLGQGGKRIVTFDWGGKNRRVVLYAEDATTFTPQEIQDARGCSLFMSIGVDVFPTAEAALKQFNSIAIDGFFLGKLSNKTHPESFGFNELIPDPSDFSDPNNPQFKGRALCQKISEPESLSEVIQEEFKS